MVIQNFLQYSYDCLPFSETKYTEVMLPNTESCLVGPSIGWPRSNKQVYRHQLMRGQTAALMEHPKMHPIQVDLWASVPGNLSRIPGLGPR